MFNMFKKRNNNFGNFGRELGAIKKKITTQKVLELSNAINVSTQRMHLETY